MPGVFQFSDYVLDSRNFELRRRERTLKLERIPMELLLLLIEQRGQLVTRDQIIERIWGKDVFLDTDNSINAAIRKIRQVLKDDPEKPPFVQTITGRGYRFIAPIDQAQFSETNNGQGMRGTTAVATVTSPAPGPPWLRTRRASVLVSAALLLIVLAAGF